MNGIKADSGNRHFIIDETGALDESFVYTLVTTCRCGHVFTSVSKSRRLARKANRRRFKEHLKEDNS